MSSISAIDVLYRPASQRVPSSAAAVLPAHACPLSPGSALEALDAAGVECAFISQCKQWSCERQWMCVDTRLEDVLRFTRHSARFIGLAGYNPFDIAESLREIEAAAGLGCRGVYLHAASFGLHLGDARLYPLFAKGAELGLPVVVQLGVAEPALIKTLSQISRDVPQLALAIVPPRPRPDELEAIAAQCENLDFVLDTGALDTLVRQHVAFFGSAVFSQRCCWGSNNPALNHAAARARELPLSPAILESFLRGNAQRFFALDRPLDARTPASLSREPFLAER